MGQVVLGAFTESYAIQYNKNIADGQGGNTVVVQTRRAGIPGSERSGIRPPRESFEQQTITSEQWYEVNLDAEYALDLATQEFLKDERDETMFHVFSIAKEGRLMTVRMYL